MLTLFISEEFVNRDLYRVVGIYKVTVVFYRKCTPLLCHLLEEVWVKNIII